MGRDRQCRTARFRVQAGWNRILIQVDDIEGTVRRLKAAGGRFRNEVVKGTGGYQVLIEDPSGNPIELFQPFQS